MINKIIHLIYTINNYVTYSVFLLSVLFKISFTHCQIRPNFRVTALHQIARMRPGYATCVDKRFIKLFATCQENVFWSICTSYFGFAVRSLGLPWWLLELTIPPWPMAGAYHSSQLSSKGYSYCQPKMTLAFLWSQRKSLTLRIEGVK